MGAISEAFSGLSDFLVATAVRSYGDLLISRLLKPLLPAGMRCGTGIVVDIKDRQVGPFDVIGCSEIYPTFGEGPASIFLADGIVFCLQARNWAVSDLTQFGELAASLKKLDRKKGASIFCAAVAFDRLAPDQVSDFLQSPSGEAVDGVLSIGHHLILRNTQGWYGDPQKVPFVSERSGPEALKSFAFFLLHLSQASLGMPFGLAEYQHL